MDQLIIDEADETQTFQKFQLVWAKILGWPWWPARITQVPSQKNGNYRVQFFADTSHAYLPSEKLTNFVQGKQRHSTPKGHYRNFVKAFTQANRLLQNSTLTKDDLQSQCTSREKLPVQQIQIINQSQQAKTESKIQDVNIQQKQEESRKQRLASRVVRRPQKLLHHQQQKKCRQIASQNEELQKEVSLLLRKYKLVNLAERLQRAARRRVDRKKKTIGKNSMEYASKQQINVKLARMIYKALSTKDIELQQRYKITQTLFHSFLRNKQKGVMGIHRALFQWIRCSQKETIQESYKLWPTESKYDNSTDYS